MKKCTKCKLELTEDSFNKDKTRKDNLTLWCKDCVHANQKIRRDNSTPELKEKLKTYQREWNRKPENLQKRLDYQKTPTGKIVKWRTKLKIRYGLTEEKYNDMLSKQDNVCAVCKEAFESSKNRHIDHCHKSGKVRGIICNHCNRALGAVRDRVDILDSLIEYLRANEKSDT